MNVLTYLVETRQTKASIMVGNCVGNKNVYFLASKKSQKSHPAPVCIRRRVEAAVEAENLRYIFFLGSDAVMKMLLHT